MKSASDHKPLESAVHAPSLASSSQSPAFQSHCPDDTKFKIDDLLAFKRGRGDLVFSAIMMMVALFFFATFWTQTGWDDRDLPDNLGNYFARQLGLSDGEGRLDRFGKILKQSWVAPMACLAILIPAAALNLRKSWIVHQYRKRFKQPTDMGFELTKWVQALEFVGWFIAYTLLVPTLGYLLATLVFGTLLPFRMGYRTARWMGICLLTSFIIVLIFRSGLQIKTPNTIWLYNQLPTEARSFMLTWF